MADQTLPIPSSGFVRMILKRLAVLGDSVVPKKESGFSLVEVIVTLAIFSILVIGVFGAYTGQMKHASREYSLAEADLELGIAKNIIDRDIALAGYGLAEDYSAIAPTPDPRPFRGTNGTNNPDTLTLMGTALGMKSRAAQGWTYVTDPSTLSYRNWGDAREAVGTGHRVIVMEPSTKRLLVQDGDWLFTYAGQNQALRNQAGTAFTTPPSVGTLVYGLQGNATPWATQPYYAVKYYLGGDSPGSCASGTQSLLRAESRTSEDPDQGDPLLSCVLDFEVAFGLDTNENGTIDLWSNGGADAAGYTPVNLRKRLKQVKAFILVQSGYRDENHTSASPIWVGEGAAGRSVALTAEQKKYRWRLLTISVTPRNLQ